MGNEKKLEDGQPWTVYEWTDMGNMDAGSHAEILDGQGDRIGDFDDVADGKCAVDARNGCRGLNPAAYRECVEVLERHAKVLAYKLTPGSSDVPCTDKLNLEEALAVLAKARKVTQ